MWNWNRQGNVKIIDGIMEHTVGSYKSMFIQIEQNVGSFVSMIFFAGYANFDEL